jgi:glutamate/tyrosine decarboxylase-like PLP-dependent enzyme
MLNEFLDSQLNSQFITLDRQNRETIRQMGYAFVDLITDEVLASQDRDFVKDSSTLKLDIPQVGIGWQDLLLEVRSQVLPRSLNLNNRRYMGHMDSVPLAITIWADALASAINNNMLSSELAPLFTQIEADLMSWFGQLFGLGDRSFGTLTSGGSLANITALLVARNYKIPQIKSTGVRDKLVAFVSDAAHTSFDKGMNAIGLGSKNLIRIATNSSGQIELDSLEVKIQEQITLGYIPFFVGAIAGTTVTGAIDNISAVGEIAKKYNCWFHVDAAYGGAAILSPQWKHLLSGIDRADSITFNPQKWMWIARTCAMFLVKDRTNLVNGFDNTLPYMADNSLNFGNFNLQGTRRTDSLKLWLALRSLGLDGYAQLVDASMAKAQDLRMWVDDSEEVELVCEPTINIVCMRSQNPNIDNATLRQDWIDRGKLWLSLPLWQGDRILKAVVLHPFASWD